MSALVVAPARTLRTTWPRTSDGPISRPTFASIWGLIPRSTTSAPSIAPRLSPTTRLPYSARSWSRRSARGWLATIWLGATSSPRRRPAIIASAITPDPIVAIVRSLSGVTAGVLHAISRDSRLVATRDAGIAPIGTRTFAFERSAGAGGPPSGADGGRQEEETAGRRDRDVREAGGSECVGGLLGRPVDLDDGVLPAVGEAAQRPPVGGDRVVVGGARPRVRERVDQGEAATRRQPAGREIEEVPGPVPLHVAEPEPGEQRACGVAVGGGPRVADVEMGAQVVGEEAVAGAFQRGGRRVVAPQLALAR